MLLGAALTTFREGLEAFLIVAVISAYLRKTGRPGLVRGVHIGIALSVVTSAVGASLWGEIPNQPLWEGIMALSAAVLVGLLLWQMSRIGKHLKADIEAKVERFAGSTAPQPTLRALGGVALLTTLLISREMVEAFFVLRTYAFEAHATALALSSAAGVAAASVLAYFWTRFSGRIQLGAVLRVTSIFLGLFLVQLLVYGIHELAESGVIEGSQAFHDATERFGPDGDIGQALVYSLVLAPVLYLVFTRRRTPAAQRPAAA
jgi:high-affinity iron transporter